MLFTPLGGVVAQVVTSVVSYVGMAVASIFDEEVREDMNAIGWNPFNADESLVIKSNKVSFYKGVPVLRVSGDSMSFGFIFLTDSPMCGSSGHFWSVTDILKHEYGHNMQLLSYGIIPYSINIGIPSSLLDNNDDTPWEISADLLGGVKRVYNKSDVKKGWNYYFWSRFISPFWWW